VVQSNSDVCTKYREAAKIANLALTGLVQQCEPGALVNELCKFGDQVITQVSGVLSFPTAPSPRVFAVGGRARVALVVVVVRARVPGSVGMASRRALCAFPRRQR
jgi:hypothetical protein